MKKLGKYRDVVNEMDQLNVPYPGSHNDALQEALVNQAAQAQDDIILAERKIQSFEIEVADLQRKCRSAESRAKEEHDRAEECEDELAELRAKLQDRCISSSFFFFLVQLFFIPFNCFKFLSSFYNNFYFHILSIDLLIIWYNN